MDERVMKMIKKYKKPLFILGFFLGYVIFWWWFFAERNVAIEEINVRQSNDIFTKEGENEEIDMTEENKERFTEFGNFWLQIDTENIKIKAPIVDGVTNEELVNGIGHHRTTAFPNKENGNVVLSGHRWKFGKNPAYRVFENINQLEIGDYVTLHYNGEDFKYEIIEQMTVDDKAVEILDQTDDPMLTLYTCTPKYTALSRLVYRAQLLVE